jgi:putative oxidoreductase
MFELQESGSDPSTIGSVARVLPRVGVSVLFIVIGYTKFNDDPTGEWYRIFEQIGIGHWFRYVTGIIQVAGGALMLFRRSLVFGAAFLACTMVGAACVDFFLLGSPLGIAPLMLLFVIAVVWVTSE